MTQHDDDLQEMMHMWQTIEQPIESMREDFVRRERKERLGAWMTIGALIASGLFFVGLVFKSPNLTTFIVVALAFPVLLAGIWMSWHEQRVLHHAPPLSPLGYLKTMRHNLHQRQKRLVQERRFFTYCIALTGLLTAYLWHVGKLPVVTMLMLTVAGLTAACIGYYFSQVRVPAHLAREHARLDELSQSLEEDNV
jgi:hypothetical protein